MKLNREDIRNRFDAYQEAMFADLASLVAIDSSKGPAEENAPFGKGPAEALHRMLSICERMGFRTDNCDDYAGSAEMGEGDEVVGVIGHLDVVPAGTGWKEDPFKMEIRDGRVWGRGTSDDKGAVIASLYGMQILRDLGVPLKRKIRLIFGTDEECGSGCMAYYTKHRPVPTLGFTPDGSYPGTYAESGTIWNQLNFPMDGKGILSMTAGTVYNAVPDNAKAVLDGKLVSKEALQAAVREADTLGCPVSVSDGAPGEIILEVKGKTGHGSRPDLGVNAAVSAANILCRALGEDAGTMMRFLKEVIGRDAHGTNLGIAVFSDEFPSTSVNPGVVRYGKDGCYLGMDIRFPVGHSVAEMEGKYAEAVGKWGLSFDPVNYAEPHYVPKDSELIRTLTDVYRRVTGDQETPIRAMGGGTYARHIGKNFIAFGPTFPNSEPENAHNANEHFVIEDFMRHCVVTTIAMYELAK